MKLDNDSKQRLITFFSMVLEFYKVVMGTFLIVFVPQECEETTCTMSENFFNGTIINSAGNICNFITFTSIGTLYFIEYRRENWCIKYLDIDDEKSTNNLDEEIENYPDFKAAMASLNSYYVKSAYFASIMMIINFIVSGFVVYQSYASTNSITSFISFFLLVSMKLYSSYNVGSLSLRDERANSAYMKEPKTYNTIDEDHRLETLIDREDVESNNITIELTETKSDSNECD